MFKKKKIYIYIWHYLIGGVVHTTPGKPWHTTFVYRLIYHQNYSYIAPCLVMPSHPIAPINTMLSQNEEETEIYRLDRSQHRSIVLN